MEYNEYLKSIEDDEEKLLKEYTAIQEAIKNTQQRVLCALWKTVDCGTIIQENWLTLELKNKSEKVKEILMRDFYNTDWTRKK